MESQSYYFFKQVRKIREQKGLNQSDVAQNLNLTPSAYNKLENGKSLPTLEQAYKIADIIQTPIYKLLPNSNVVNHNYENNHHCTIIGSVENVNLALSKAEELKGQFESLIELLKTQKK